MVVIVGGCSDTPHDDLSALDFGTKISKFGAIYEVPVMVAFGRVPETADQLSRR